MKSIRHFVLLIGLFWLPINLPAQTRCSPQNLSASALRGDAAQGDWLSYRNEKNGLSFRYPRSMRIKELDPASFHLDVVPDLIVDLQSDDVNNRNITVMRFICARGRKTTEMAASKAGELLATHPIENSSGRVADGAIGSMQVDGRKAIVSCGCGRAACQFRVLTLQPYECQILPMVPGEGSDDNLPPPHDGRYPVLSIIKTVHFGSTPN